MSWNIGNEKYCDIETYKYRMNTWVCDAQNILIYAKALWLNGFESAAPIWFGWHQNSEAIRIRLVLHTRCHSNRLTTHQGSGLQDVVRRMRCLNDSIQCTGIVSWSKCLFCSLQLINQVLDAWVHRRRHFDLEREQWPNMFIDSLRLSVLSFYQQEPQFLVRLLLFDAGLTLLRTL